MPGSHGECLYVVDTSSLIRATEYYPLDRMGIYWGRIDSLISEGRLISTDFVYREIEAYNGILSNWIKKRKILFQSPTEEEETEVKTILKNYPNLVNMANFPGPADPYVIALAKTKKMTKKFSDVVLLNEEIKTDETRRRDPNWKPRIPNVCADYRITSRTVRQLIHLEEWDFPETMPTP